MPNDHHVSPGCLCLNPHTFLLGWASTTPCYILLASNFWEWGLTSRGGQVKDLKQQYIHIPDPDSCILFRTLMTSSDRNPMRTILKIKGNLLSPWNPVRRIVTTQGQLELKHLSLSLPFLLLSAQHIWFFSLSAKLASASQIHTARNMAIGISQPLYFITQLKLGTHHRANQFDQRDGKPQLVKCELGVCMVLPW